MRLEQLKTYWGSFLQVGLWVLAIGGTFIVTPPVLRYSEEIQTENLTRFLIAALSALLFIPLRKKSAFADYTYWYKLAIISFMICLASILLYSFLVERWSINYYDVTLVTGDAFKPEAAPLLERVKDNLHRTHLDINTLIKAVQGKTDQLWVIETLRNRFYKLSLLFLITFLLLSFFLITTVQSILCYERKKAAV
ncbi:MAG TPA: hypothetical protein VK625_13790 [Flavitalea sp.]|nr:hypothetical protein [Flavitalea sp.]